jgi:hypothetical protein
MAWTTTLALSDAAGGDPSIFISGPYSKIRFSHGWGEGAGGARNSPGLPHPGSRWCVVSTPYEMFRAALPTLTPDGEPATIIITRQGQGSEGRVWVTFSGAWVTTAVMNDEAERFEQLVSQARNAHS